MRFTVDDDDRAIYKFNEPFQCNNPVPGEVQAKKSIGNVSSAHNIHDDIYVTPSTELKSSDETLVLPKIRYNCLAGKFVFVFNFIIKLCSVRKDLFDKAFSTYQNRKVEFDEDVDCGEGM